MLHEKMIFEFDLKCRDCGETVHFYADLDDVKDVPFYARCLRCDKAVNAVDCERLYHLMDILESFEHMNDFGDLTRISVHRDKAGR